MMNNLNHRIHKLFKALELSTEIDYTEPTIMP